MPEVAYITFFFVLAVVCVGWVSVLSGIAKIQGMDEAGISLRTLAGTERLAWSEIKPPVQLRPRSLRAHVVIRPASRPFLSIRSAFVVVGSLDAMRSLAVEIGRHVAVQESRFL